MVRFTLFRLSFLRGRLIPVWVLLIGLGSIHAPVAVAQLTDCRGIRSGIEYKIAVDEVTMSAAVGTSSRSLIVDRLTADLQTQIEEITVEEGGEIVLVPCVGRRPHGELDFDRNLIEALNNNNVVLEIWGSLGASEIPNSTGPSAQLRFVLIPLRYYEHFLNNSTALAGVYVVLYSPSVRGPALTVFERSSELRASVALSMALKKIKEGRNEMALRYLCKAELFFKKPDSRIPPAKRDVLLEYIAGLKSSTLPSGSNKAASLLTTQAKADVCLPTPR